MSETDLAVIKPEMMKSYIWLQTSDGSIQQVEQEIAMYCPLICQEIIQKSMGSSKNCAISLPQQVTPATLSLIFDYCRFHQVPGRSNKERKSYDEKFVRMGTNKLCELVSAADSLQIKPLVDLISRALARKIEGRTPEEIREIFHLPDDLTEEEKLEPLKNITADPRIRLLNRLYAKKRKELKERERLKIQNAEVEEEHVDERSVDDLLSFINGNDGDPKGAKTSKNKKKNRRKKDHQKSSSSSKEASEELKKKELNGHNEEPQGSEANRIGETSNLQCTEEDSLSPKVEFDDGDLDDDIDPELKEKIDREVEDFARRLNSDWPERMQDFLSSGRERTPLLFPTNGNSFLRRHASYPAVKGHNSLSSYHVLSTTDMLLPLPFLFLERTRLFQSEVRKKYLLTLDSGNESSQVHLDGQWLEQFCEMLTSTRKTKFCMSEKCLFLLFFHFIFVFVSFYSLQLTVQFWCLTQVQFDSGDSPLYF